MSRVARSAVAAMAAALTLVCAGGCNSSAPSWIRITFHDTRISGADIARVDIAVIETDLVDPDGRIVVVSTERQQFDLLQVTKNAPVVLAHARVPSGVYQQIRLVLEPGATLTLADGTVAPLKVPSGETSGIKIDGVFDIPAGRLYTLDIDLDPARSISLVPGDGYHLKPVVSIIGSDVNSGNFYYAGTFGGDPFVTSIGADGSLSAATARYPKYVVVGHYVYDGLQRTLTIVPEELTCPGCSRWERLKMKLFADVPDARTFDVLTFGADDIDLRSPEDGAVFHLYRVPEFSLQSDAAKEFTVVATIPDASWTGKTVVAQLAPEDGDGRAYTAVDAIPASLGPSFDFAIPRSAFGGPTKDFVLLMAVVGSQDDLVLRSDGTVAGIQNVFAENSQNAVRIRVARDTAATAPVVVPFTASR